MNPVINILNRRLGEALGLVCSGSIPRFAWKYAPDEPFFVYDRDNRTLLKKCWADAPAAGLGTLGRVWLLAEWKVSNAFDHMGFSPQCETCQGRGKRDEFNVGIWATCHACGGAGRIEGVRMAAARSAGYSPYFETALAAGQLPSEALTANYIWAISKQLAASAEHCTRSFANYMTDEKYAMDRNAGIQQREWRETAAAQYDEHTGAFGNLEPGKRDGYFSFQNNESFADI